MFMRLSSGLWKSCRFLWETNYVNFQSQPEKLSDVHVQIAGFRQPAKRRAPKRRPKKLESRKEEFTL